MANRAKFPNFFIIGAPKCGTTALSDYLRTHPDIFFSSPKEPNFFNTDMPSRKIYRYKSLDDYLNRCFSGSEGFAAIGEGSVRYLYSSVAVEAILKLNPQARFIVMLRNPVDLGHSLYHQHLRNGNEDASSYEEAWRLQEARKRGEHLPADCAHPRLLHYDERCRLGDQLERLFARVPDRSRILLVSFAEFIRDTPGVYARVLAFLGLERDDRSEFPAINEYGTARSRRLEQLLAVGRWYPVARLSRQLKSRLGIANWPFLLRLTRANYRRLPKRPMSAEFRASLTEHFRDDVEKVKRLTGIDLYA